MRGKQAISFHHHAQRAFTLVELLIVIIILGIIAAIVIPQFTNATGDAKLSGMVTDLAYVRKQIDIYRLQHNGDVPALATFEQQMTQSTNLDGTITGSPTLGPYLNKIPTNPFTDQTDIGAGGTGTSSWYYNEITGEFRANCHAAHIPY
jgi:general secretion pathway protein G